MSERKAKIKPFIRNKSSDIKSHGFNSKRLISGASLPPIAFGSASNVINSRSDPTTLPSYVYIVNKEKIKMVSSRSKARTASRIDKKNQNYQNTNIFNLISNKNGFQYHSIGTYSSKPSLKYSKIKKSDPFCADSRHKT